VTQTPSPARNRLLASLSSADLALLQPDLDPVSLDLRQVLETANEPITHNFFIDHGTGVVIGDNGLLACRRAPRLDQREPQAVRLQGEREGEPHQRATHDRDVEFRTRTHLRSLSRMWRRFSGLT